MLQKIKLRNKRPSDFKVKKFDIKKSSVLGKSGTIQFIFNAEIENKLGILVIKGGKLIVFLTPTSGENDDSKLSLGIYTTLIDYKDFEFKSNKRLGFLNLGKLKILSSYFQNKRTNLININYLMFFSTTKTYKHIISGFKKINSGNPFGYHMAFFDIYYATNRVFPHFEDLLKLHKNNKQPLSFTSIDLDFISQISIPFRATNSTRILSLSDMKIRSNKTHFLIGMTYE